MSIQLRTLLLTVILWAIILFVIPLFYSGATPHEMINQGDLFLSLGIFTVIGVGLALKAKAAFTLNYIWGTMTASWILSTNFSRLISKDHMEILDATYVKMFYTINELGIIILLSTMVLGTSYYLFRALQADKQIEVNLGPSTKGILTTFAILVPILWCVALNARTT